MRAGSAPPRAVDTKQRSLGELRAGTISNRPCDHRFSRVAGVSVGKTRRPDRTTCEHAVRAGGHDPNRRWKRARPRRLIGHLQLVRSSRAPGRHSSARIWAKARQGRDAVASPAPWIPVGPAPCFWRIRGKLAPAARDLQYRRRGTRRRVVLGARPRRDRLARSVLMTELGDRSPHHQGATSRPRIFSFTSSYSLRLAVGVCRSRCAEQALRFDRVAAATT
jgi:hypothetical protein